MTAADLVPVERVGAVAVVTLNRPEAMNALSVALRARFAERLAEVDADPLVRAVVLTGAGERAFCAGLDLKELGVSPGGVADAVGAAPRDNPVAALAACRRPVVAAINGVAVTGGLELALACDILVCSERARFADTHVKVGVLPGWGLSQRLSRLIGVSRAKEMSLTGRFVDAATAFEWGLVNEVLPAAALLPRAIDLGRLIAEHDPAMVGELRDLIDAGAMLPLREALSMEAERSRAFNRTIDPAAIDGRREAVRRSNRAGIGFTSRRDAARQ